MPRHPQPLTAPVTALGRRWLSLDGAAEHAGVSTRTIRRHIAAGHITGYRVGGSKLIRIDANEIDSKLLRPIPTAGTFDEAS